MHWDYWSQSPEALHQVTILYSDRGIPKTHRHMNGYGSHTYSFINEQNKRVWVRDPAVRRQGFLTVGQVPL